MTPIPAWRSPHLFGRRLKSSQIGATFITIFLKCANIRRVLGKYYFINLCVSPIYEAGQKDSQVHSYNENLQSTFLKMLKCNFAMFSIWQASTWQTGVGYECTNKHKNIQRFNGPLEGLACNIRDLVKTQFVADFLTPNSCFPSQWKYEFI